jgi:hypothetical protein
MIKCRKCNGIEVHRVLCHLLKIVWFRIWVKHLDLMFKNKKNVIG